MPVKLTNTKTNDIPVREMKDGQLGVITQWRSDVAIGNIVQVVEDLNVVIDVGDSKYWDQIPQDDSCRVRLLEVGDMIEVTSN